LTISGNFFDNSSAAPAKVGTRNLRFMFDRKKLQQRIEHHSLYFQIIFAAKTAALSNAKS